MLILAILVERSDMVELLLEHGADPNITDQEGNMSPLMHAVSRSLIRASYSLTKRNADVNLADNNGVTALMMACALGDQSHCELLISKLAEPDAVDCNGWTALHYCAFSGSAGIKSKVRIVHV